MKKFFVLAFGLCLAGPLAAQGLDGLFDEADFAGGPPAAPAASQKNAAPSPAPAPASAAPVKPASVPASSVSASAASSPAAPVKPASSVSAPAAPSPAAAPVASRTSVPPSAPKTFDLPQSAPAALTLPYSGASRNAAVPSGGTGLLSRMSAEPASLPLPMLGERAGAKDDGLSLFERRRREIGDSDADVESFDIAGMMLGMTPSDIMEVATANGFSVKFRNRKIPPFLQWKYKKQCLKETAFSYAALKQCIRETAWRGQEEYISRLQFEKPEMKEKIVVEFTSRFGGNRAYRIHYVSKGDHSLGSTSEARYQKNKRRRDFLYAVMQKYGQPDDEDALLWGIKDEGAYLEADISPALLDVSLTLENIDLTDEDSDNMFLADQKDGLENKFSF